MGMCLLGSCEKYRNNEPCEDNIVFCEKMLADHEKIVQLKVLAALRDEVIHDYRIPLQLYDRIVTELGYNVDDVREYQK